MSAATELELESELSMLESEGELELAGELEHELGLASELVGEFELEHEQETEHEAFFNSLAAMADRSGRSQALRRIALAAARAALKGQARPWPVVQGEAGFAELELEGELGELEGEHEFEFELETSPGRLAQYYAAMEHEGHSAAEAANEQEAAEHFLPLIGLAAKFVLPKLAGLAAKKLGGAAIKKIGGKVIGRLGSQLVRRVAPRLIRRVQPQLTRGIANVTRTLFRNRSTRPLIHAVPRIARTTVARLGAQVAGGRRITPQIAARTLAQQTARTLSNPRVLAQTYRRSLASDRRYHRRARRVLGVPAGAPVRAANDAGAMSAAGAVNGMPLAANGGIAGTSIGAGAAAVPGAWGTGLPAVCRCSIQAPSTAIGVAPMASVPTMPAAQAPQPFAAATCPSCGR
jgi:hypothetical protein